MRSPLRVFVLALVVLFAATATPALAQRSTAWRAIALREIPREVLTGQKRLFAHDKITRAEKSDSGQTVRYRLTIRHKGAPMTVIFDAQGHTVR